MVRPQNHSQCLGFRYTTSLIGKAAVVMTAAQNHRDIPSPNDAQSEATVEEFGREGMGVSAKE